MSTINVRGVDHFYQYIPHADNSRPVLVFVHGWLLSHCYWLPLIEQLKDKYACLSYDLRGFGKSQPPFSTKNHCNASYSLHSYAQDLQALLTALGIKKAWLIGHSLGASIALWTADICPDIVRGIFCINAGGGIYLQEEFERFRKAGENIVKFRPPWLLFVPFLDRIFARMMVQRPLDKHWGRQRIKDFLSANAQAAISSLLEATTEEQVHYLPQIVARLSRPVYFLAGKQDKVMEIQYVNHLASFHRLFHQHHQQIVFEIDNCGHFAMLEQTDTVVRYILELLYKHEENCVVSQNQC